MDPRLIILQPTPYCNLWCTYCYLSHRNDRSLMSAEVLEAVREKILAQLPADTAAGIVWHAGEPTAAPIEWYERAYACLEPDRPRNSNFAMQTNGITIDARWIDLFRRTHTEVSLSIDGPERFHDARRLTRNGKPTWHLALRGLKRLQDAEFEPRVITVLHPDCLSSAPEFFDFYRDNGIQDVSFSVDELEGSNRSSSFGGRDYKSALTDFLVSMLALAYRSGYPLYIREVERIAGILAGAPLVGNEQVEPWAALVIAANGNVSTFSPELMEVRAPEYNNFIFGNILVDDLPSLKCNSSFKMAEKEVARGIVACESCRYFGVCGGGSPVNKYCEKGGLAATETDFCRLTTQASADALLRFLSSHNLSPGSFSPPNYPAPNSLAGERG
ncbi:GRRM system radical SAM/SPASM domain protein [Mesorhizobium sp. M1423]|uniref:cyclophane-forming radical SAM/SPASM peptide maturase GrrM/OscB n=1 Tax=Mesorhizobium sp. M1423 TaxID=2957101 RepID=UPI003334D0AF